MASKVILVMASILLVQAFAGEFLIGQGIFDVTGEVTEGGFMGYAVPNQVGSGLHFRPRARAFVVVDPVSNSRVAYVSVDLCMGFQMVKLQVIENLKAKYGSLYVFDNVIISGTHTHSTPGGVGGTALVDITTYGFIKANWQAAVDGIVGAISRAHDNIVPGSIKIAQGTLDEANINRSPAAYLRDPDAERSQYAFNTDHDMTVLRFQADDGTELGMVNFFAVHGVSMNNTNTLVSGDNKGVAAALFEKAKNGAALPGQGKFVAAFGQSNEGDVSPNTKGPSCPDGTPCDFVHSTCGGKTEGCIAKGPGSDMFESTQIIGQKQADAAMGLYNSASVKLTGSVDFRHQFVDMQNVTVNATFSQTGKDEVTCRAAMGYSFAAGTTDGPGDFDFTQADNSTNPFWSFVAAFLAKPTAEQIACQAPKPILLDVGLTEPIEWVPFILPLQVVRIGQLWIVAVPGEFTTMAGRRLRNTVVAELKAMGVYTPDTIVVISGLANSYSHYTTTFEEYQEQRYEGASTLYGPHSLGAYLQTYSQIVQAMVVGASVPAGPTPEDMRDHTFSFHLPVVVDGHPIGKSFGDVAVDVASTYRRGDTVSVTFWGASPRNDLMTEKTFLTVELQSGSSFTVVATDSNWETKFLWSRVSVDQSHCTVLWTIPADAALGTYRIQHFGVYKTLLQQKYPYQGTSATFTITA